MEQIPVLDERGLVLLAKGSMDLKYMARHRDGRHRDEGCERILEQEAGSRTCQTPHGEQVMERE